MAVRIKQKICEDTRNKQKIARFLRELFARAPPWRTGSMAALLGGTLVV